MSWKNLSTWLKGAIIGIAVDVVIFIIGFYKCFTWDGTTGICKTLLILHNPLSSIGEFNPSKGYGLIPFMGFLLYPIIGAFIGFIISKIKSSKIKK